MVTRLDTGGSQARVMNLVLVITASRLVGGPGNWLRTLVSPEPEPEPSNERGLVVVTPLESAEQNKNKN